MVNQVEYLLKIDSTIESEFWNMFEQYCHLMGGSHLLLSLVYINSSMQYGQNNTWKVERVSNISPNTISLSSCCLPNLGQISEAIFRVLNTRTLCHYSKNMIHQNHWKSCILCFWTGVRSLIAGYVEFEHGSLANRTNERSSQVINKTCFVSPLYVYIRKVWVV